MKYIDTEMQLIDIFIKPLDATHFASLWRGGLVFAIHMAWFDGSLYFTLYILYPFTFLLHFLHIHLS
jgi:hypothetical protein